MTPDPERVADFYVCSCGGTRFVSFRCILSDESAASVTDRAECEDCRKPVPVNVFFRSVRRVRGIQPAGAHP